MHQDKEALVVETTAVITAAGRNDRWGNHLGTVKHLAPIDPSGETVIGRTVKMLASMGVSRVYVVTHREEVAACVAKHATVITPEDRAYLTSSILCSKDVWTGRTAILLGDVFFTRDCMERILACEDRLRFFGVDYHRDATRSRVKRSELYAFSFDASAHDFVEQRLKTHSSLARFRDGGRLRLSCLGRALAGEGDFLRLLFRYNTPPKPPAFLRAAGFGPSVFWRAGRLVLSRPHRARIYGKLWGLYTDTMGIRLFDGDSYGREAEDNARLEVVDDMTQDIDMKEDYDALMEKLLVTRGVEGG